MFAGQDDAPGDLAALLNSGTDALSDFAKRVAHGGIQKMLPLEQITHALPIERPISLSVSVSTVPTM